MVQAVCESQGLASLASCTFLAKIKDEAPFFIIQIQDNVTHCSLKTEPLQALYAFRTDSAKSNKTLDQQHPISARDIIPSAPKPDRTLSSSQWYKKLMNFFDKHKCTSQIQLRLC